MKFSFFTFFCIILLSLIETRFIFKREKLEKDDYILTVIFGGIFYSLFVILSNLF
jgi:hypothetical protein